MLALAAAAENPLTQIAAKAARLTHDSTTGGKIVAQKEKI